ncbi:MAG TPA: restriction endonuclease, partial [Candidatus Saccharimonadales bacterium]|nr:restriction endonuclease [Candidatus Saccharimonadales bacterium]
MSDVPLNLSSLNAEQFEDLIEAIFRGKLPSDAKAEFSLDKPSTGSVVSVIRSGRGQDGGVDLLVTTMVTDCITSRLFKWVVQCKHRTNSKSIGVPDFSK